MSDRIYTFSFLPDWMQLTNEISQIDRFDASWATIEKREGQTLKQLKSIATVRSVGASTRIEGSGMTDDEVAILIKNLAVSKLEERDQQEVAGYFETMELIAESYRDIEITENNLKHLHNMLMKYSEKDSWHKGNYKQHSNVVEATNPDGSKYIIFKTAEPGWSTEEAMKALIKWYQSDTETLPLIKDAVFIYDFLSIHPFQDGNGRLSRLLGMLLLLKHGYSWIQYVSFEHEIEHRKSEYYRILMQCQRQRPGEDVYPWVAFFLDCMKNIQYQLKEKLDTKAQSGKLTQREKKIYSFIEHHPGSRSGEIAKKLDIPLPTVKRILSEMVKINLLEQQGTGAGTNYIIGETSSLKKDVVIRLTNSERKKEITLANKNALIEIKKIILTPLFDWSHPDEWNKQLVRNGLFVSITCKAVNGAWASKEYPLTAMITPYHYQPVISINPVLTIPDAIWQAKLLNREFPLHTIFELSGVVEKFDFEVMVVYDEI